MKQVSQVTAVICDNGLFPFIVERLARDYKKVFYCNMGAIMSEFPTHNRADIGKGMKNVEVIDNPFGDVWDEADLWVFPDVGFGSFQTRLEAEGKLVWGSRMGEELEIYRSDTKKLLKKLGLPVGPYELITGMEALREYLQSHKNVFVKLNDRYREDWESLFSKNYPAIQAELDERQHNLGPMTAKTLEFVVEEQLNNMVECYDKETEILTEYGWMRHEKVRSEYKIATLNPKTKTIEYHKPIEIIHRIADKIYVCQKQNIDLAITRHHSLILSNQWNQNKLQRMELDEMSGMQYYMHAEGNWNGKEEEWYEIPPIPHTFGLRGITKPIRIKMDNWLEFLGWFISEGCITRNKFTTCITQSDVHPKECRQIEKCLNNLPFNWNRNGLSYRINSKQLFMHLLACSRRGKRIPNYVKQLSSRQIKILLDAIFAGDGSTASNGVTKLYCVGVDKKLADDVQECILKIGKSANITTQQPNLNPCKIGNRIIKRKSVTYIVSEHKIGRHTVKRKDFQEVDYNDTVWCVNVPNHIVYVRRNGKAIWSGNCGIDGYTVDGDWPTSMLTGIEVKDQGYIGKFIKYADLPKSMTQFNDTISPILKSFGCRCSMSDEKRIDKSGKSYMIDACMREPSPPGELKSEFYTNIADIIWQGANGNLIDPIPIAKYGAQALIECTKAPKEFVPIIFPPKISQHIKLRNCKFQDGMWQAIPQRDTNLTSVGGVIGWGNTLEEAIEQVKEMSELVEGSFLDIQTECFEYVQEDLEKLSEYGLKIF
jgi:hypothetical protein